MTHEPKTNKVIYTFTTQYKKKKNNDSRVETENIDPIHESRSMNWNDAEPNDDFI